MARLAAVAVRLAKGNIKMAELNFNALRQAGPANFYQGLMQGQAEQQANALTMQKAAQEQEMNALRKQQLTGAIGDQQAERQKKVRLEKTGMFRERLLRAPTPEAAREIVKMQYADPDIGPVLAQGGTLEQSLAEVSDDPSMFERYKQQEAMGMSKWMESQIPKLTPTGDVYDPATRDFIRKPTTPRELTPPASVAEYNLAKNDPNFMRFLQDRAAATRAPTASRVAGGGGGGETPPKPLNTVQSAKRRDQLGKEFKTAQNALQTTQDVLDSINFVKTEPGLSRATGFIGTMLPSIPEGAAASAETRLKNLEGKITALGKAQAASTGAIGSIANQEWKILADQIAAIEIGRAHV